jgi:hypothetical protein
MSDRQHRYLSTAYLISASLVGSLLWHLAYIQPVVGNAAMPSINNVGTGNSFTPVFPADSKLGGQIAMQSELVKVNLYPGFGVVKGEYHMFNTTTKPITIKVGYPNNGSFINPQLDSQEQADYTKIGGVFFNELAALKVLVNGKPVPTNMFKKDYTDWHIWSMEFAPRQNTDITIYYTIDTHESHIRRGYSSAENNGFAYILESGKLWKDKIHKGTVFIKLNDGLKDSDLLGVVPRKTLRYNPQSNYLIYRFTDLEPDNNSNILINYSNKVGSNFKFADRQAQSASYYQEIDRLVVPDRDPLDLKIVDKDDFSVSGAGSILVGLLFLVVMLVPMLLPILAGVVIFRICTFIYRRWPRNRSGK